MTSRERRGEERRREGEEERREEERRRGVDPPDQSCPHTLTLD